MLREFETAPPRAELRELLRVSGTEAASLREENARLREENARLHGPLGRAMARGVHADADAHAG